MWITSVFFDHCTARTVTAFSIQMSRAPRSTYTFMFCSDYNFPAFLCKPHVAVFMSFTPEPELPLHAPWYVEGDFDVNLYYHGWRDISDPPTPATSEHDTTHSADMSAVSDLTVEYIPDDGEDERFQQLQMRIHCHMNPSELVMIAATPTHPAECIAKDFLRNGGCDADQLSTLLGHLPRDRVRTHQRLDICADAADAFSFTTGAFQAGGLVGVRNNAYSFPWVTAFLCQVTRFALGRRGDDFAFTSLSLLRNVVSGLHRDGNNHSVCLNRLVPLSFWTGGELWCHDTAGDITYPGTSLVGKLLPLSPPFVEFDACELHGTMPWLGERMVLAVYHIKTPAALTHAEMDYLKRVGFAPLLE